ncbi:hypothetical protein G4H71_15850 [Rhodococcus triatomae]|nr:hypothetical protein [Rhodococcus triatomae]QNG24312.1 hypothetical protein G4H71_15850 [Rhodococcus triatomae]
MLRYFLGRAGMRDLELPRAVPWSVPGTVAANVVRYQTLTRFRAGRRYLERRGDRHAARILTRYFGSDTPDVGPLEARPRSTGSRARGQSRVDSASVS